MLEFNKEQLESLKTEIIGINKILISYRSNGDILGYGKTLANYERAIKLANILDSHIEFAEQKLEEEKNA